MAGRVLGDVVRFDAIEHNFTEPVVSWIKDWEDAGGLWKIIAYATAFFLMIPCIMTIIGIPVFVQGATEYGRQDALRGAGRLPAPADAGLGAVDPDASRRQIEDLTARLRDMTDSRDQQRAQKAAAVQELNQFQGANQLAQQQLGTAQQDAERFRRESEAAAAALAALQATHAQRGNELTAAQQASTGLQDRLRGATAALAEGEKQREGLNGRITQLTAAVDKLTRDEVASTQAHGQEATGLRGTITERDTTITQLREAAQQGNAGTAQLNARIQELQNQLGQLTITNTANIEALKHSSEELNAARADLQKNQQQSGQTAEDLHRQLSNLQTQLEAAQRVKTEADTAGAAQLASLRKQLEQANATHQAAAAQFAKDKAALESRVGELEGRVTDTNAQLTKATDRAATAEQVTQLAKEALSQQKAILDQATTVMDAAKKKFTKENQELEARLQAAQAKAAEADALRVQVTQLKQANAGVKDVERRLATTQKELSDLRAENAAAINGWETAVQVQRMAFVSAHNGQMVKIRNMAPTPGSYDKTFPPMDVTAVLQSAGYKEPGKLSVSQAQPSAAPQPGPQGPAASGIDNKENAATTPPAAAGGSGAPAKAAATKPAGNGSGGQPKSGAPSKKGKGKKN